MSSQTEGQTAAQLRPGPLAGYRVLDLTTVVMGPAATQLLGDLGAEVIKVEAPEGDSLRRIGPAHHASMGTLFLQSNRNKKSLVLDLKNPDDRAHLLDLATDADALLTNIRPGPLKRLGLDYAGVREANPQIVYCQMVGYGSDGPYSGQAVYDDLIQAAAGVSGLFKAVDGSVRYAPLNICDRVTGLYAAIATLSALLHRAATGEGQEIEVPMFETMASFVLADNMGGASFVPPIGDVGYKRLLSRFRGPYPTADGHLALVVYTDRDWQRFSALVGRPEILEDPTFASQSTRTENAEACGRFLGEVLTGRPTAEWITLLREIDIPCAPVNELDDLFNDPHLQQVGLFAEFEHPTEGRIKTTRPPLKFSRTPASIRRLAPNLGEHPDATFDTWVQNGTQRQRT
ncbi:MAG: CoA transferase [Rhodobacter sp.]|nr:CoA transferase [Paracoccaceae bacterium]MCC0077243.1 CoA transferase [Rhodobacter sp.]